MSHDKLFRGVLVGSALVGEVESIRYLGDDVALVHATGSVLVGWRTRLPKRRRTRNTIVAVRTPEGWRFTAIHNGRIRPVGVPEPDSFPSRIARGLVRASGALHIGRAPARAVAASVQRAAGRRAGGGARHLPRAAGREAEVVQHHPGRLPHHRPGAHPGPDPPHRQTVTRAARRRGAEVGAHAWGSSRSPGVRTARARVTSMVIW